MPSLLYAKKWNQKQNFCVSLWEVVFTKWYVIVLNEWIASLMGLGLSTATIYYKASVLCCHFHCTIFFVIWNLSNWPEYRKKIDNREWEMEVQASKCAIIVHICVWEKRVPFYHWFICIAGNFRLAVCAPSRQCFYIKMCEHISMLYSCASTSYRKKRGNKSLTFCLCFQRLSVCTRI